MRLFRTKPVYRNGKVVYRVLPEVHRNSHSMLKAKRAIRTREHYEAKYGR